MMAPEYYVFTGGERIPDHVTHVLIDKALNFVCGRTFENHPNIQEVICHDGVEKIEEHAFHRCRSLRRVIMPGVKIVERGAFRICRALSYIECGKLEIIGEEVFIFCFSLNSIDLPSIKIVDGHAFASCLNLVNVKFGKDLELIRRSAFRSCRLERISLPLKDGVITDDNTFQACENLNHVDLDEGVHETIGAFLMEEWKNDMHEEIDAINEILPHTSAGRISANREMGPSDPGEKTQAIRTWIASVLRKIIRYKAEHRRYLNEAAATLQLALPNDIVFKNILPFVELPAYTFDGED